MHKYEFGKREKDKNNEYSHLKEARMNEQVTKTECQPCASRAALSNRANANLAAATRPRLSRRVDSRRERGYATFVNMHNNDQRVHMINIYANRMYKICIFIFYVLVHALCNANQNNYNPKSLKGDYVEIPGQLSQLAIHGNDAIAGHGIGYKKGSRAPWNHFSSNFLSDKVSSLTVLINAKHLSLSPFSSSLAFVIIIKSRNLLFILKYSNRYYIKGNNKC